jgi:hypothetical protein
VLKNGGPVHPFDENWSFGRNKAEVMLACLPILARFSKASDLERQTFKNQVIQDPMQKFRIQVTVEMKPDFEHSTGRRINRPWLMLTALPPGNAKIGLGALKCEAICAVEEQLRAWLNKP